MARPAPLSRTASGQPNKSFTRFEPPDAPKSPTSPRIRASTIHLGTPDDRPGTTYAVSPGLAAQLSPEDVFDRKAQITPMPNLDQSLVRAQSLPARFDELPVELISLADRFIESLTAKVYNEPPTIERLAELFQAFYVKASNHIATHIATLALRIDRQASPTEAKAKPAAGSRSKVLPRQLSREAVSSAASSVQHQMLTATEVAERKKARKLLEYKRLALEESIERHVCEKVYTKIWRHKSTLDEIRDEKLRSKTAALALVGIGLKDLGIETDPKNLSTESDVRDRLAPAREQLANMNLEKTPLGKLHRLTTAHQNIVDVLSTIHSSTSSADEILPTLIYTLITSPAEGINIISNLSFIQRFRTMSKLDGEAAYCITNLEAAIVFCEDVDLASLREDELPQGPPKTPSRPHTPAQSLLPPATAQSAETLVSVEAISSDTTTTMPPPRIPASHNRSDSLPSRPKSILLHQRRLSNLLNPPTPTQAAKAISSANDAVRSTADQSLKTISTTLDNSFQFLFGRLREHTQPNGPSPPQTLEEARKLVSQPPAILDEEGLGGSETSSLAERETPTSTTTTEDRLLNLISGRPRDPTRDRDRSVDSSLSTGSGRRITSATSTSITAFPAISTPSPSTGHAGLPNPLDSVKSLGSSFNPLNHIGSAFRGFGKTTTPTAAAAAPVGGRSRSGTTTGTAAGTTTGQGAFEPPIQRFLDAQGVSDLTVRDLEELLRDYQRLARVVERT